MNERDELTARLRGPHEWGYRDPVVGGFVADDTPYTAADQIERDGREIKRLTTENRRMQEALTPSDETKFAYIGEFSWTEWESDENGNEQGYVRTVPWTTINEIMTAIRARARAALNKESET